jgi:hypothetical protein
VLNALSALAYDPALSFPQPHMLAIAACALLSVLSFLCGASQFAYIGGDTTTTAVYLGAYLGAIVLNALGLTALVTGYKLICEQCPAPRREPPALPSPPPAATVV